MDIINLSKNNSILSHFLYELRDKNIQKDKLKFRKNIERVANIMAYEISKKCDYIIKEIETPINNAKIFDLNDKIVIATILRAGLPFHFGFLDYFDDAGNAFISARREYDEKHNVKIRYDSIYTPSLENKILIVVDPMLATGNSMVLAYKELIKQGGKPKYTHIACVLASKDGIKYVEDNLKGENITIWAGDIDDKLTSKFYIDPGMGDAGDLAFGDKL